MSEVPPIDVGSPGPARRWPAVTIGVAAIGIVCAAVAFVATSGENVATSSSTTTTTTPLACVQPPRTTTTTPAASSATGPPRPPDGTYLGSIAPERGPTVTLLILTEGSQPIPGVSLAPGVRQPVSPTGGAVTVKDGVITDLDTGRVAWDDSLGRGDRPCTPDTGCTVADDLGPHAWPGGVDGDLGTAIGKVPNHLAAALAKWGVMVDPLAMQLGSEPCTISVPMGDLTVVVDLGLADDGSYVLLAASSDGASGNLGYQASGESVSLPLPPDVGAAAPTAKVSFSVRYGDRTATSTASTDATSIGASIERRPTQPGSFVLTYLEPNRLLRRLEAVQVAAGDNVATTTVPPATEPPATQPVATDPATGLPAVGPSGG